MNSSQAFDILQKEYPILQYPLWIVFGLIIILIAMVIIKKIAENWGEDLYGCLKKLISNWRGKETSDPVKTSNSSSPKEPSFVCSLSLSLPQRNPNFTGREGILDLLRTAFVSEQTSTCKRVLSGLGGKGKSQIALEYAHRYRNDYRFIWWLPSEEPAALKANYAGLAKELDLPEKDSSDPSAAVIAVKKSNTWECYCRILLLLLPTMNHMLNIISVTLLIISILLLA